MNSYRDFLTGFAKLFQAGKSLSPKLPARPHKSISQNAPVALIFSPHPDDECIVGALPLRLLHEANMRIINVAVTLGSDKKRRSARLRELKNACAALGFELVQTASGGLERINPDTRSKNKKAWAAAVKGIALILKKHQPRIIFIPHQADVHPTHIGTHWLVMDALKTLPQTAQCFLVETEFWGQMASPNLLVESSTDDVVALIEALSLHTGEVRRNPYHLRLPAWMQDNVRRGAELVGDHGTGAPDFLFGTLYRVRQWKNGGVRNHLKTGKLIGAKDRVGKIFRR